MRAEGKEGDQQSSFQPRFSWRREKKLGKTNNKRGVSRRVVDESRAGDIAAA